MRLPTANQEELDQLHESDAQHDDSQKWKVGVDINLRKGIVIAAMFVMLFALPVGVYDSWARNNIQTARKGSVQGISTSASPVNTTANKANNNQLLYVLIGTGSALLVVPAAFFLLRRR